MASSNIIPNDTPENSARAIIDIINDEAKEMGARIEHETKYKGLSTLETVDIFLPARPSAPEISLRILLNYVESPRLHLAKTGIGHGFIGSGHTESSDVGEQLEMELLPKETFGMVIESPFRWGVYPRGADPMSVEPLYILDGLLLRNLLRERLQFPLPS